MPVPAGQVRGGFRLYKTRAYITRHLPSSFSWRVLIAHTHEGRREREEAKRNIKRGYIIPNLKRFSLFRFSLFASSFLLSLVIFL